MLIVHLQNAKENSFHAVTDKPLFSLYRERTRIQARICHIGNCSLGNVGSLS